MSCAVKERCASDYESTRIQNDLEQYEKYKKMMMPSVQKKSRPSMIAFFVVMRLRQALNHMNSNWCSVTQRLQVAAVPWICYVGTTLNKK